MPNSVTPSMPENTAMPSVRRISAPAPTASASGNTPRMNAMEVMMIGRKTQPAGFDGGIVRLRTAGGFLLGELDNQNGIFAGQSYQHDEADLHKDVDIHVGQCHADGGTKQAHGNHKNHGQRQAQAFVLCGQNEEHQHHGECKHDDGCITCEDL